MNRTALVDALSALAVKIRNEPEDVATVMVAIAVIVADGKCPRPLPPAYPDSLRNT